MANSSSTDPDIRQFLEPPHSSNNTQDGVNEQKSNEEAFNYDDILEHIGGLGKYQLLISMLLLIPGFFPGIVVMSYSITGYAPKYGCLLEECDNATTPWLNPNFTDIDKCNRYDSNTTLACLPIDKDYNSSQIETCNTWAYDTSLFHSTIITDFDLVCDREWMQTLGSTAYMFGMLFGGIFLGNLADIIGRRLSFTLNNFALAVVMTASAFSPDIWTFCVLRFFCGMAGVFQFSIVFVWGVEAVGKKYRTAIGSIYSVIFSVGSAVLGLIAYFIRDWRTLQLVISIPIFIPVVLFWVLPESTRWLITKKRYDEATELIQKAAKMNGKSVPEHLLVVPNDYLEECNAGRGNSSSTSELVDGSAEKETGGNIITVFCSPVLCGRIFVMFIAWIASIMSYYGITFSAANLSGDFFINYELSMVIEIPSYFVGIFLMAKGGRRFTLIGSLFITGAACLATGLVAAIEDPTVYEIVFSLTGKFFASISAACLYTFTSELFPTNSRSAAIGLCSTAGRIGSILAPIIADMGKDGSGVSFVIFSIINFVSAVICLILPETNNLPLPATIQEAEDLSKTNLPCFRCGRDRS